MLTKQHDAASWLIRRVPTEIGKVLVVALGLAFSATSAYTHSFSQAVVADGEHAAGQFNSAIKGILLAARERDRHPDETSDGHLGGLDVFIVPLPTYAAETIEGLKRATQTSIDIAILIGPEARPDQEAVQLAPQSIVIRSGTINTNPSAASTVFATRYQAEYGTIPDQWAAEGYNAARRIDLAVRSLNGVDDRRALIAALAATKNGIEW
jgi:hypothetical protein